MPSIAEIYDTVYGDESTTNPKKFIAIVESQVDSFLTFDFPTYDDRYKTTRLVSDYALDLAHEGFVKKSLPYLSHAITLFETDGNLKDKDLLDEPMYESLVWQHGIACYSQKHFLLAQRDFKKLLAKWPENDKIKGWYNGAVSYRPKQMASGFTVLIAVSLFARYVLDIRSMVLWYGDIVGLLGVLITSIYRWKVRVK